MSNRIYTLRNNEFFSFVMNGIAAAILVIGNSSYTFKIKGQSIDSLRPNVTFNETTNDNIKSPMISIPSKKMIRLADNEINGNMIDLIDMINSLKVADLYPGNADHIITKQFFDSFIIPVNASNDISDEDIEMKFKAENILFERNEDILKADIEINQVFNSAFRLVPFVDYILYNADNTMNMNFLNEFQ